MASDAEDIPSPPDGYVRQSGRGAFTTHNGPYFVLPTETGSQQAFFALPRHCNGLGIVHGGMLSAFLDGVLAASVGRATGTASVTIHLSIDFLSMARRGEWVFGESRVTRQAKDVVFVEGRVHTRGHDVVRGSGVFKLMHRKVV
jgi:uncharacterized protein (TIGR00369 family)